MKKKYLFFSVWLSLFQNFIRTLVLKELVFIIPYPFLFFFTIFFYLLCSLGLVLVSALIQLLLALVYAMIPLLLVLVCALIFLLLVLVLALEFTFPILINSQVLSLILPFTFYLFTLCL